MAHRRLRDQVARFGIVGVLAAVVDLTVYQLALAGGVGVHVARALSFVVATALAYVLNRRWSFSVRHSRRTAMEFVVLYGVTFVVVLALNAVALALLPVSWWATTVAWAVSQAFGSTCNFIMLRFFVFSRARVRV